MTHEYDERGRHRLQANGTIGDWAGYSFIAFLDHDGKHFAATTEYYEGCLPRVFEVVAVPHKEVTPDEE